MEISINLHFVPKVKIFTHVYQNNNLKISFKRNLFSILYYCLEMYEKITKREYNLSKNNYTVFIEQI